MSDQFNIALFIRTWFISFFFVVVPVFVFTGFSVLLLYGLLASFVLAIVIFTIVSLLGNSFGNILFGLGDETDSEQSFAGELDKARHFLRQKDMVQLKGVIDGILEKDPTCLEAMLIKSQALVELGNRNQAKVILREIVALSKKDDPVGNWDSSLLDEITQ